MDLEEVCCFQPTLACIRIQLRLEAHRDEVRGNAQQLRQVFLNLVLNAADAVRDSDTEGELAIQTALREVANPGEKDQVHSCGAFH